MAALAGSSNVHLSGKMPSSARRKNIKIDPLRALEPARKKLTMIEAQRVMCVIEDTKKKVDLITLIPHVIDHLDKYRIALGGDLVNALERHQAILESLHDIEARIIQLTARESQNGSQQSKKSNSTPEPEKLHGDQLAGADLETVQLSFALVQDQLRQSSKSLLREFFKSPAAMKMILDDANQFRSHEQSFLLSNLGELRDILMEKLLTTPVEEGERVYYLDQVSAQERSNSAVIEKLETELNGARAEMDEEMKKKNDVIKKLLAELNLLKKQRDEEIRRTKSEAEKQEAADTKNSEGKRNKLIAEVNQLRAQLQNMITENREEEYNLRQKKYKIEIQVENWIQKYDQDMGERQDEFEEIDEIYTEEKRQLHELEERFKTLEEEYNTIMNDRRAAREKREAAERELNLMIRAATAIQAVWRSFKVRKALKQKKKGKGKKGKKGKK